MTQPELTRFATDDVRTVVRRVWCQVLEHDRFGEDDSFFDTGGDSVLLAAVRNLLYDELPGRDIPLLELFRRPTFSAMCDWLAQGGQTGCI